MKKKIIIILVCVGLVSLIVFKLANNFKKINSKNNIETELPFVTVKVSPVESVVLNQDINLMGSLEAYKALDIVSQTQGQLITLEINEGQYKTQGSNIASVDKRLKELAVKSAKISVNKLEKDLDRYKNLFEGGGVTEQQLDDIKNNYETSKIQLEQAEKQLADATVKSPISGIITKKYLERGDFVNIGTPIARIVDISKLKVKLNVSESVIYQLSLGTKATITSDAYPEMNFKGIISFISPQGDESHNYPVEIEISNNSNHPLKAGSFVNVILHLGTETKDLCIPREALQGSINKAQVYIASNGKALLKDIVVKNGDNNYLKVISGLKEGEQVIVTGQINLADGKIIKIIK